MSIQERKIENQISFWSLLSPFLILVSLTVLLFKVSDSWYFPLIAIIGIPLCIQWRMKGLAASLGTLVIITFFGFQNAAAEEQYWHLGMALAMAVSFFILTLSLDELGEFLRKIHNESKNHLIKLLQQEEHFKSKEQSFLIEIEKFGAEQESTAARIQQLECDLTQEKQEKQAAITLITLTKDEYTTIGNQNERLLRDLAYRNQQIALLTEKLDESELTIQGLVNTDKVVQLQQQHAHEISSWKSLLADLQEQHDVLSENEQKQKIELDHLKAELNQHLISADKMTQAQLEHKKEISSWESLLSDLQGKYEIIDERAKNQKGELDQLKDELKQLQDLLEQKDQARREIEKNQQELQEELERQRSMTAQINSQLIHEKTVLTQQKSLLAASQEESRLLLQKLDKKIGEITALEEERQKIEKLLEEEKAKMPEPDVALAKRMEALYLEAKKQFQDKSAVLDATRRELFMTQEYLSALQKENEEKQIYDLDESIAAYEQYIRSLIAEEKDHQTELALLYSIIDSLLKKS